MERVICLFIGYVFGLFQTAYFYGKTKGIDIRKYGSGNAGTTNALRVLGTKAGLIVLAGDCLKCIIAVCITRALFSTGHPENIYLLCLYTGAGAVIGHNFPFYMGFKGGKGIAATAGLILSFHPYFIVMGVVLFFGTFLTTHYVSLGSLLVYAGFMIQMVVCGQMGLFGAMPQSQQMCIRDRHTDRRTAAGGNTGNRSNSGEPADRTAGRSGIYVYRQIGRAHV